MKVALLLANLEDACRTALAQTYATSDPAERDAWGEVSNKLTDALHACRMAAATPTGRVAKVGR